MIIEVNLGKEIDKVELGLIEFLTSRAQTEEE